MSNRLQKLALAGVAALTIGVMGRFTYKFVSDPGSHSYKAPKSDLKSVNQHDAGGITVTVLDDTPAASCPNPLESILVKETEYVKTNSWEEIERRYAGVLGGVVVFLHDYNGNDKKEACELALRRLVETTVGSVVDRTYLKYFELTDAIVAKGLDDCTKDIQLRYKSYRFGQ